MTDSKKAYAAKMEAQVDKLKAQLDQLKAKAAEAHADVRADYHEQVEVLARKHEEASSKLHVLKQSSGEAWSELRDGMERAWSELSDAFGKAQSSFK